MRGGLGRFAEHLTGSATLYDDAATTALLARGPLAVRRSDITMPELVRAFARIREHSEAFRVSQSLRIALRAHFDRAASPEGWNVSSRLLYRRRPSAAIAVWVAANASAEVKQLASSGRFSIKPD